MMTLMKPRLFAWATLMALLVTGSLSIISSPAYAKHCWRNPAGKYHCDSGKHLGHVKYSRDGRYYYSDSRRAWFDTRTGKIVKGSLIGAGVGAGTALLLDKSVGKTALLGAGVGAGVQAIKTSRFLDRR